MTHRKKVKDGIPVVKSFKNDNEEVCILCPDCEMIFKGTQSVFNKHYERIHLPNRGDLRSSNVDMAAFGQGQYFSTQGQKMSKQNTLEPTNFDKPKNKWEEELEQLKQQIQELQSQSTQARSSNTDKSSIQGSLAGSAGDLNKLTLDFHADCKEKLVEKDKTITEVKQQLKETNKEKDDKIQALNIEVTKLKVEVAELKMKQVSIGTTIPTVTDHSRCDLLIEELKKDKIRAEGKYHELTILVQGFLSNKTTKQQLSEKVLSQQQQDGNPVEEADQFMANENQNKQTSVHSVVLSTNSSKKILGKRQKKIDHTQIFDEILLKGVPNVGNTCYLGVLTKFFQNVIYYIEPTALKYFEEQLKSQETILEYYQKHFQIVYGQIQEQNDPLEAFDTYVAMLKEKIELFEQKICIENKQTIICSCGVSCESVIPMDVLVISLDNKHKKVDLTKQIKTEYNGQVQFACQHSTSTDKIIEHQCDRSYSFRGNKLAIVRVNRFFEDDIGNRVKLNTDIIGAEILHLHQVYQILGFIKHHQTTLQGGHYSYFLKHKGEFYELDDGVRIDVGELVFQQELQQGVLFLYSSDDTTIQNDGIELKYKRIKSYQSNQMPVQAQYKANFIMATGDLENNPVDLSLVRDIRGDGTYPIGSKEFIVVNDGNEKLHKTYSRVDQETQRIQDQTTCKFQCGKCKLAFRTPHAFDQHRKTEGCIGARMKITTKRSATNDQTLTCVKKNRHLLSNFFDDVIKKAFQRNLTQQEFEIVSKLFCDGVGLKHPAISDQQQQQELKKKLDPFLREGCKRPIKNILSRWLQGIQWITFSYSDALVDNAFMKDIFDLVILLRKFARENMQIREKDQLSRIVVNQIDTSVNVKGTLCSLNFQQDWTNCGEKLSNITQEGYTINYFKNLQLSFNKGDNSMNTCFQYQIKSLILSQQKEKDLLVRLKLYAKTIDLIEKESVGKSIGSNSKVLLGADYNPDKDYYDQLQECQNDGMSRAEISHYFPPSFSFDDLAFDEEQQQKFLNFTNNCINSLIDSAVSNCKRIRANDLLQYLSVLPGNICVIAPQFITIILADNKEENYNTSSFIGSQKSSKIMEGANATEARKVEEFIKRHASIGAVVTVFIHDQDKPVGTVTKEGQLFVPPGVVRESKFQPTVPNSYRLTTTQDELRYIQLAGFDKLSQKLKQ